MTSLFIFLSEYNLTPVLMRTFFLIFQLILVLFLSFIVNNSVAEFIIITASSSNLYVPPFYNPLQSDGCCRDDNLHIGT